MAEFEKMELTSADLDDNESRNLRILCDEIFGELNFKSDIAWQKRYTRSNNTVDFTTVVEHVLVYARSDEFVVNLLPRTEDADSSYTNPDNDPRGPWMTASFVNPATKEQRPNLTYPLKAPDGRLVEHPTNAWKRSREEYENLEEDGLLWWGADGSAPYPRVKLFLNEARGLTPINLWSHEYAGNTDQGGAELKSLLGSKVFDFPKPTQFLRRVLEHASNPGCIILDFFSGTAGMAEAIMQKNAEDGGGCHFIMVQLPEECDSRSEAAKEGYANVCEIGKERIRRAGAKIAVEVEEANRQLRLGEEPKPVPDIGFRVLKLDESGIERPKPGELLLDVVKPDRSDEDIIFEMMLKWGLELTLPIEKVDAVGYPCYSVACGELVCCLADGLNMQVLDAIADMEPRRVLMLDRILDDTTKLNAVQAFKRVEEKTSREVELRTV